MDEKCFWLRPAEHSRLMFSSCRRKMVFKEGCWNGTRSAEFMELNIETKTHHHAAYPPIFLAEVTIRQMSETGTISPWLARRCFKANEATNTIEPNQTSVRAAVLGGRNSLPRTATLRLPCNSHRKLRQATKQANHNISFRHRSKSFSQFRLTHFQ